MLLSSQLFIMMFTHSYSRLRIQPGLLPKTWWIYTLVLQCDIDLRFIKSVSLFACHRVVVLPVGLISSAICNARQTVGRVRETYFHNCFKYIHERGRACLWVTHA